MISHRMPSSSAFWRPFSRLSIVCCKEYITSSGRRSAELPFSHGFSAAWRWRWEAKRMLKLSGVAGGGIDVVTDIGRCREKNVESVRSMPSSS